MVVVIDEARNRSLKLPPLTLLISDLAREQVDDQILAARQDAVIPVSISLAAFVALCLWSASAMKSEEWKRWAQEWKTRWIPEGDKERWQEFFRRLPLPLLVAASAMWTSADRSGSAMLLWLAVGFGVTGVVMFAVRLWRSRE